MRSIVLDFPFAFDVGSRLVLSDIDLYGERVSVLDLELTEE